MAICWLARLNGVLGLVHIADGMPGWADGEATRAAGGVAVTLAGAPAGVPAPPTGRRRRGRPR